MSKARFDTLALHTGATSGPATSARVTPIHLNTPFVFRDSEHVASLFNMERAGRMYLRISSPTIVVSEKRTAAPESNVGATATASGQAALRPATAALMGADSHIVTSSALYDGSHNLLHYTLRRFGIGTTFVKPGDINGRCSAIRPSTRLLFSETLGNSGLDVLDIPIIAPIVHGASVPLLVDSTFTTTWLLQLFMHDADLAYHSATKFLDGRGTTTGNVFVGGGTFDYVAVSKHPELTKPYAGFHNIMSAEESTVAPFLLHTHHRSLHDFGARMNPMIAWQLLQGIQTLPLCMAQYVDNVRRIVAFLASRPMMVSVAYPELESCPGHVLAKRLLPRDYGAVFSSDLRGDRHAGQQLIESLGLFSRLANVGDAHSLIIHPVLATHFRMSADTPTAAGISEGTVHLSVGPEGANDLIDDLKYDLRTAERAMSAVPGKTDASATGVH